MEINQYQKYINSAAPLETPIKLGSTNGFFKTVCKSSPLIPRAAPTRIVMMILGKRTSTIAFTLAYSLVKIPTISSEKFALILPLFHLLPILGRRRGSFLPAAVLSAQR